jgi:hypothetical protein
MEHDHRQKTAADREQAGYTHVVATARYTLDKARLWVSKVVLVAVTGSWHGRFRRAATPASSRRALPLLALCQLGLILRLLRCRALLGASFQHGFGLRQPRQAVLSPCHLLAHHQPIGDCSLVALVASEEELLDLGSQLRLQLQQALVANRIVPGGIRMDLGPVQADRADFQHARQMPRAGAPARRGPSVRAGMHVETWPVYHGRDAGCLR